MNHQYNLQFDKLCESLKLGEVSSAPHAITGGLLHRMFAVETTKGKYAIKALNPQIMARPTAMRNYIRSENIANIASNRVPALPVKIIKDKAIHEIDNQFYLIFEWIDGCSLKSHKIGKIHCEKMGSIVARIHTTDFTSIEKDNDHYNVTYETDWNSYLNKGEEFHPVWTKVLQENIDQLYMWSGKAKRSASLMSSDDKVIGHGDLEPKNVMWRDDNPIIIDWESAGYVHPMHDLVETAIYWSVDDSGRVDQEKFLAFIRGYQKHFGPLKADWKMILDHGYLSKLEWLEYNLKRSLWIECTDEKEHQLGTLEVIGTLKTIKQYEAMASELEDWLIKNQEG